MTLSTIRNFLPNAVLAYMPPAVAHGVNLVKNVKLSALEEEMRIVPALVVPGSTVIDVGANLGLYCEILAAKAGKVLAIEPQPKLAAYLRQVLPANVQVIETALSSIDGETILRVPRMSEGKLGGLDAFGTIEPSNRLTTMRPGSVDEFKVSIRRLDDVVRDQPGPVSFIKIDVEGHEGGVISGALELIRRDRPALMIEIEPRHNPASYDLFDLFAAEGYESYCLDKGAFVRVDRNEAARLQRWAPGRTEEAESANFAPHVANFFFVDVQGPAKDALLRSA